MIALTGLSQTGGNDSITISKSELAKLYLLQGASDILIDSLSNQVKAQKKLLLKKDTSIAELRYQITEYKAKDSIRLQQLGLTNRINTLETILLKDKFKSKRWGIGPQLTAVPNFDFKSPPYVSTTLYLGVGITYNLIRF